MSSSRFAVDGQWTFLRSSPCWYSRSVKKSSPPVCEKLDLDVLTVGSCPRPSGSPSRSSTAGYTTSRSIRPAVPPASVNASGSRTCTDGRSDHVDPSGAAEHLVSSGHRIVRLDPVGDEPRRAKTRYLIEDGCLGDATAGHQRHLDDGTIAVVDLEGREPSRDPDPWNGGANVGHPSADRQNEEQPDGEHQAFAEDDPQNYQSHTGSESCPSSGRRHQLISLIRRRHVSRAPPRCCVTPSRIWSTPTPRICASGRTISR